MAQDGAPERPGSLAMLFWHYDVAMDGRKRIMLDVSRRDSAEIIAYVEELEQAAHRFAALKTLVLSGQRNGGFVTIFAHEGIGDDPPTASVQVVESFDNPNTTRAHYDGASIDEALDAARGSTPMKREINITELRTQAKELRHEVAALKRELRREQRKGVLEREALGMKVDAFHKAMASYCSHTDQFGLVGDVAERLRAQMRRLVNQHTPREAR